MKQHLKTSNPVPKLLGLGVLAAVATALSIDASAQSVTKDKVKGYPASFKGKSGYSASGGGHSAKAGDYALDLPLIGSGPAVVTDTEFFKALNAATAKDELTVTFWAKKYDIAAGSAFWFNSPASNNGERGYQAHVPWSDSTIYFDTAGCCTAEDPSASPLVGQRLNANIDTFPDYTGDVTWWTGNWHLFAFSKKAGIKQIWIDGKLFLASEAPGGAAPLPSDFYQLEIGSDNTVTGGIFHSLVDDFAVFSTQLSEANLLSLAGGALPSALPAATGLLAYWDFNDFPAAGAMVLTPAANDAKGSATLVQAVNTGAAVAWTTANTSLKVDGTAVTPTLTTVGNVATLSYTVNPRFLVQTKHNATLTYPDGIGGTATTTWSWTVGVPPTLDKVKSYPAVMLGSASYGPGGSGHTAKAGDFALDLTRSGGPVKVTDAAFMAAVNAATAKDELSVAIWVKKYDIADGSAFWFSSPTQGRVYQAHIPWSNNNIYFDTAGCCGGDTRINAGIDTFGGYTGDNTWWTDNWHLLVFTKKADVKNIYIDGQLFLNGSNTGTLSTDIDQLMIGSDNNSGGLFHALVDDFAVFGKELTEANITALFGGTLPSALPSTTGLIAYWDFNDVPAEGLYTTLTPAPDATAAKPDLIKVVHMDGTTALDAAKASLKVDGAAVTATITKTADLLTLTYVPSPIFAALSVHKATLVYDGQTALEWSFTVAAYTKDLVKGYRGDLIGTAKFSADAAGHSGAAGDYAVDMGRATGGQGVNIVDLSFINVATANDELAVAGWQKLYTVQNSAFFWGVSPSSSGTTRGWGTHAPWSGGTLYFDTAGCCDGSTQRINAGIDTFPDYSGDASWWNNWHYMVFQKKASTKEIWIDGKLFFTGESTNPLPTDFTTGYIGFDPPDNASMAGLVDDFAIFGKSLTEAQINQLVSGTKPTAMPAAVNLLAYWDFNDGKPAASGQPAELGQTVNGFQDDFTGATRDPNWVAVGPSGDQYIQADGVLKSYASAGDPNHLLYMGPGGSNNVQEVLARVRMVNFGSGDAVRGGICVNTASNVTGNLGKWIAMNLHFRNDPSAPPALHFKLLDDARAWGPKNSLAWAANTWYWLRLKMDPAKVDGTNIAVGKAWPADGTTAEPADWEMKWASPPTPLHGGYAGITGASIDGLGQFEVDYILIKSSTLPSITVNFAPAGPAATLPFFTSIATATGNKVVVNWFGAATLQTAPAVTGTWTDKTGNTPQTITATDPVQFYRLKK